MRGINRGAFGPNLSNKIRRSRTGTFYQCAQCGASHQLARDARNCTHNQKQVCDECETRKYTMCPSCKDDGYTICRECCEYGPLPCEIWDSVGDDEEMDAESYGFCAACDHIGMFRVEDLPVGPRWFCTEKHYAQYAGLPVKEPGYYGFEAESFNNAEDKKMNPLEKAEVSGVVSGATMEGLETLLAAEEKETVFELGEGRNYRVSHDPEKGYVCAICDATPAYLLACKDYDPAPWEFSEHLFCSDHLVQLMFDEDNVACDEDFEAEFGSEDEGENDNRLLNEIIKDVFKEFKIKTFSPRWGSGLNHWHIPILESQPKDGEDDVYIAHQSRQYDCYFDGKGKCFEIPNFAISDRRAHRGEWFGSHFSSIKYVSDSDYGMWNYAPTEDTKDKLKAYQEKLRKKYNLPIELFVKETYHENEYGYEPSLIMGVSLGKSVKAAEEPPEKDDPLESWMEEDYHSEESDPHPSLYWFVKGEIMKILEHGDMTESDLATIVEMVATKAPLYMIDRGMKKAEELGDRPVWEVLKMSAITRIEIEKMDDEAVFSEKLGHWASEDEEWGVMKDSSSRQWYCYWCGEEYGKDRKGKLLAEKCFKTKCESDGTLTPYDKRYLQLHDFSEKFLWEFPNAGESNPQVKKTDRRGVAVEPHFDIYTAPHRGLVADGPIGNAYDGFHYELNEESLKRLNQFVDDYNHANSTNIGFDEHYSEKGHRYGVDLYFSIHPQSFEAEEDDYVEMMECPHCSEFGDGEIPTGVDIDRGDRWSPPTADITGWEMCEYCEGKGEVEDTPENQSIPTWDWDYLIPDEPDYDRYEDRYDDWDAESNGDRQLEESIKRTKMSAIRTGLAITTFGIVLWNLWTNKKQEKQISDIMGLV